MKIALLSLLLAFKLLLGPVAAHEFEAGCDRGTGRMADQASQEQDHKDLKKGAQPDAGKMAGAGHHCCCPHVSANNITGFSAVETVAGQAAFPYQHMFMRSVDQGPPLKPPSHA
ncbi:MAG: hypothetical protein ACOY2B_12940 [Pseudomonadota bacterium]